MDGQPHIAQMFAFVCVDKDGTEGIPAFVKNDIAYPLVGADMARIESIRPMAERLANQLGAPLTLCKFSVREELEVITPEENTRAETQE